MDYVIGEILACLAAASLLSVALGWLIHSVIARSRLRALEINKNVEIEKLESELAGARQTQSETEENLGKSMFQVREAHARLVDANNQCQRQLAELHASHQAETSGLNQRIAALTQLEPAVAELKSAVADKDAQLHAWMTRLEGLVQEKDQAVTAHKTEIAAAAAALAAAEARHEQLRSEQQNTAVHENLAANFDTKTAELERRLQALSAEHQAKLDEVNALVAQRDEQLKSFDQRMRGATAEKDTMIGKLRSIVAQIDPLKEELTKRDQTIVDLQSQLKGWQTGSRSELDEAQRQVHSLLAAQQSLKAALDGKDSEIAALTAAKASAGASPAVAALTMASAPAAGQPATDTRDERIAALESQLVDVAGRHAAAKSELENWAARYAALEARLETEEAERQAATNRVETKTTELDKTKAELASLDAKFMAALSGAAANTADAAPVALTARVSELEKALDAEVPREAALRQAIAASQAEIADLRAQIADRDERLEAWDSRFHASIGELHGEVGTLTAKAHSYETEIQARDEQIRKLRAELASAPLAMAAAAGAGAGPATVAPAYGFIQPGTAPAVSAAVDRREEARRVREALASELSLKGVQFLPSSAELIPQSLPILEQAADVLHRFTDVSVEIGGHTDSWGEPQENFRLSRDRAGAVKEYLVNRGIAAWRLTDVGYGDTRPIDSNDTADGRFANRRIEIQVR